ncbi:DUF4012 domain-containing protein [Patescibacteria group bacterium]|nr:DUF4012 domain-containing protein [Patescibacteria group bacterium]
MTNPAGSATDSADMRPPLAHIIAQDPSAVDAVHQYFLQTGCDVVFNQDPSLPCRYLVISGDVRFVKYITDFLRRPFTGAVAIVFEDHAISSVADITKRGVRVVLHSLTSVSPREVDRMFAFYFLATDACLDLRTERETVPAPGAVFGEHAAADQSADRERIASELFSAFGASEPPVSSRHALPGTPLVLRDLFSVRPGRKKERPRHVQQERAGAISPDIHATRHQASGRRKTLPHIVAHAYSAIFTAALLIFFLAVWYLACLSAGIAGVGIAAVALQKGSYAQLAYLRPATQIFVNQTRAILDGGSVLFSVLGKDGELQNQERLVSVLSRAIALETAVSSLLREGAGAAGLMFGPEETEVGSSPAYRIQKLQSDLAMVTDEVGLLEADFRALLDERMFPFSVRHIYTLGTAVHAMLSRGFGNLTTADALLSLYTEAAGFRTPKTYLVLLQNSAEVRPAGGFIGSVAIPTLSGGQLSALTIQDVYALDGQLKGHVDPPLPIRQILGEEHWFLRDANWDPDFYQTATRSAWFYAKETGNTVNGVIGISTPFIVNLLQAVGPVTLTDYNDEISADNFYGKSLYYTNVDFFPGSTQKKDFLGSLAQAMLAKITSGSGARMPALFQAVEQGLQSRDIQFMFENPESQALAERYGWTGGVSSSRTCAGGGAVSCVRDRFGVYEANLGVNKVNYFVSRSEQYSVLLNADGTSEGSVSIILKNAASGKERSSGAYKTYLQVYLPEGASVTGVTLDGQAVPYLPQNSALQKPRPLPYYETAESAIGSSASLGVALTVPVASMRTLSVSYVHGSRVVFGNNGAAYELSVQKQPGVEQAAAAVTITYPVYWIVHATALHGPGSVPQPFVAKEGVVGYNTTLSQDQGVRLLFTK